MKRGTLTLLVAVCLGASGCDDSDSNDSRQADSRSKTRTTGAADPSAALERAVRVALKENNRLGGYVLWHNEIPSWARRSTRGHALAEIRESTAERRRRGVRVRTASSDFDIASVRLDPSYTRASAMIRQRGRVRLYRHGRRLGRVTTLSERARIELRRLGREPRFVVWAVTVIR